MALAVTSHVYDAPKQKVWGIFADIGNVSEISPGIVASRRENKKQGRGAKRSCDFGKGMSVVEEVTAWQKGEQLQFTGVEFLRIPMKKMVATFNFAEADGKTTVTCAMEYDMKMGFLLNPMMKGRNRKAIRQMLEGAAAKL